jgi:cell division protein FtsW
MAKLAIVVYLAVWLYSKRDSLQDTSLGLVPLGIILGLLGAMILKQPDLSAAFTVVILGVVMFFLAGGEWKQIFILVAVTVLVGVVVMKLNSTGSNRLADYVAGLQDPAQSSYHVSRALEAIVNGGWFGVGLGNANTKFTGLPVPPTDSIFAVVAEEFGIFGSLIVLCLYAVFIWRGLRIAHKAPDMLGSLLAGGLIIWIGMEAMINMGVLVGLLPFAGNALPLMSSGGSSLVMTLMAIGIILNVSSQSYKKQPSTVSEDERRNYSASIDLRRRNGRRGLSRPNRSQRTIR